MIETDGVHCTSDTVIPASFTYTSSIVSDRGSSTRIIDFIMATYWDYIVFNENHCAARIDVDGVEVCVNRNKFIALYQEDIGA